MLCQICKKNPATIHIQEIVNGKKQTLNLCLSCAGKKTLAHAMFDGMDLSDILNSLEQNLSEMGITPGGKPQGETPAEEERTCPVCSWSSQQFRKTGRLGCPECYKTFESELPGILLRTQRSATHTGKLPAYIPDDTAIQAGDSIARHLAEANASRRELEMLEQDLKESVRREEFELAAELRDKIEVIRGRLQQTERQNEDVCR